MNEFPVIEGVQWMNVTTVLVAQLCLTLCDPTDCSSPGFSVQGILQARLLEWIAIPTVSIADIFRVNIGIVVDCMSFGIN